MSQYDVWLFLQQLCWFVVKLWPTKLLRSFTAQLVTNLPLISHGHEYLFFSTVGTLNLSLLNFILPFFRIYLWFFEVTLHSLVMQHRAACPMMKLFVDIISIFSIPLLTLVMKILKDAGPRKDLFWSVNISSLTVSNWTLSTVKYSHWVLLYLLNVAVSLLQAVP